MKVHGRCHCGAITFEAEADPGKTMICHCTDCQSLTGTAFRTSVPADAASFRLLSGTPAEYEKVAESGTLRAQGFCAKCGTPLYGTSAAKTARQSYTLRIGTFREREHFTPVSQIWTRSAWPWVRAGLKSLRSHPKESGS